jgi:uncharacterized membrane protein YqiK
MPLELSTWMLAIGGVCVALLVIRISGMIRYIPNTRIGILEKVISLRGSVRTGFIALGGETGFQPNVLRGGWHLFFPFQFRVHQSSLVTIPQGRIGYIFARDGRPLEPMQTLASNVAASDFQDVAGFLRAGGQRGPQRQILREGTYAINLAQFVVLTEDANYSLPLEKDEPEVFKRMAQIIAERGGFSPVVIKGADDLLGIVTVHDGPSLPQGEIIAPTVGDDPKEAATFHNNFQDPERFLQAGGRRGRQLQVLVEGTYYLNRLFATVETIPKTVIEVGYVGVVVSYNGEQGQDLSGEEYRHGEMVQQGKRGVWAMPLLPGKYAFNLYAANVLLVPTTNIILKWISNESGAHKFDENLTEVSLITKDAFSPNLPLSVVIHIDYKKAPLVIQRFGDIKRLVEQTLDPMVSAYFKNIGQTRTLIQLIQDRANIQTLAGEVMKDKFSHYNLELEEVLIGTPKAEAGDATIETILNQLRARQIAEEQVETFSRQEKAALKQRELREAEARAAAQQKLTESEVSIAVQSNQGKAEYQRSLQQAAQIRALAEAEAEKAARVGIAQAIAIEEQVRAYGGPQFQVTQQVMNRFAEAIERARVDVVPKIVMGGAQGQQSNVLESLLALMLSDKLGVHTVEAASAAPPEVEQLKKDMRASLMGAVKGTGSPNRPA